MDTMFYHDTCQELLLTGLRPAPTQVALELEPEEDEAVFKVTNLKLA
jgi:hypothetical protein